MGKGKRNIKVVDIFAGPGGLGEGFSSFRPADQSPPPFRIVLSAEKEAKAHQTLTLRAFFRRFTNPSDVPSEYYRMVRGELDPSELKGDLAREWKAAEHEALLLELGAESARLHLEISTRVSRDEPWVLVGGPPCQAYSLAGRSRNKGKKDYVAEKDHRNFLYREYLEILNRFAPPIFIMENVRGILTARLDGKKIFPTILADLHDPGRALIGRTDELYDIYSLSADATGGSYPGSGEPPDVNQYLVKAEELGIPQARHRVILLGIRRGAGLKKPRPMKSETPVSVGQVVRDLPKLRSALSRDDSTQSWEKAVESQKRKILQALKGKASMQDVRDAVSDTYFVSGAERSSSRKPDGRSTISYSSWYHDERLGVTLNHDSRSHMPGDLGRYLYCAAYASVNEGRSPTSRRGAFPASLAPNHKNWESGHFTNRFRVQSPGLHSATVVSHISKDGHYFIHHDPAQCRSYTVREAARAQTFPDNYFFKGNRTEQYIQVGNAVPPLLASRIASVVWDCMS